MTRGNGIYRGFISNCTFTSGSYSYKIQINEWQGYLQRILSNYIFTSGVQFIYQSGGCFFLFGRTVSWTSESSVETSGFTCSISCNISNNSSLSGLVSSHDSSSHLLFVIGFLFLDHVVAPAASFRIRQPLLSIKLSALKVHTRPPWLLLLTHSQIYQSSHQVGTTLFLSAIVNSSSKTTTALSVIDDVCLQFRQDSTTCYTRVTKLHFRIQCITTLHFRIQCITKLHFRIQCITKPHFWYQCNETGTSPKIVI